MQEFQIDLSGTKGTQCRCITQAGVANLWAPEGRAVFVLWVENTQMKLSDEQVSVDVVAGGPKQVELLIDMLRVEFTRAEGTKEEDDATWLMFGLVDGRLTRGEPEAAQAGDVVMVSRGRYLLVPEAPLDQAAAFEIDVSGDRKVILPPVKPGPTANVLLKLRDEDWHEFEEIEFEYFVATDRPIAQTPAFAELACRALVRVLPDGLEVRNLPAGKQIVLRGYVNWRHEDYFKTRLLRPAVFKAEQGVKLASQWTKAVSAMRGDYGSHRAVVLSDFPGHALPWSVGEEYVQPGRHEVAVFDETGRELVRIWANVPDDESFDIDEFIQKQLKERGLLPKEDD
jgi:hypothetical protein